MTKNKKYQKTSPQTQADALKMAKATQRPGQTKEQTKLIALGVEKAITLYKKQQKEKSRELNRKLQKASKPSSVLHEDAPLESESNIIYKQSVAAWVLLFVSWLGFVIYLYL